MTGLAFPRRVVWSSPSRPSLLAASLLLAIPAIAACGRGRAGVETEGESLVGLHYEGTTGYVGHPMSAQIENDDELCPYPWVATVKGVEGDLPAGLSLVPPDGKIEGTPQATGTWTFGVLLDDIGCGERALGWAVVPVTITIQQAPEGSNE